ncbi:MAG: lytic transglycosylase domain-containing protein [Deltaproteobacteria bacterium]|nr:lytic transglycosylase domain-containing protein [Deltaproteobacteria bacterium]
MSLGDAALAGGLYRFVDEHGGVHYTDAPADPRYREVRAPVSRLRFNTYATPTHARPTASRRASRPSAEFDPLIEELGRNHGVAPALVKAVIAAESHFDSQAVSSKGAQGLMQLMPATADMLGVGDPFEPRDNVGAGVRYLRQLLDRFGDPVWAVAAYNAGPEAVDRYGGIPPYSETQEYVRRVMAYYRKYHGDPLQ